jgi:hypothetical protein
MKLKKTVRSRTAGNNARLLVRALLLGFFALERQAPAQYVLAPAPSTPDQTPPAVQQTSEMDVFASPPPTESQPFKWGAFTLRPHPYYQFLYADGLQARTNRTVNTLIHSLSPGALLEMGQHWTLDYSPVFTLYSNNDFSDTFGQSARLEGGTVYNDWVLGLIQTYTLIDAPSMETASQTRQEYFDTLINGAYTINSKMSLDLQLNQKFVSADQYSSYHEWSTMDWLNYQFWPRLNTAIGVGGGFDDNQGGPDAAFEQAQGRVQWRATDRIGFQLHGGVEVRQFLGGNANDLVNPIFGAAVQYRPLEMTRISLAGQRVVSTSYLEEQTTETTRVSADLNQQLPEKFFLNLNGGYQFVKYVSTANDSGSDRRDNYYFLNVQLGRAFLRRGSFAVVYQFGQDDSSEPGFSFTTHQVGVQIGYSY